jgi:predicted NAD-dependent protein-ADP-ribosyltransferase YbiA (DUF1768 family)
MVSNQTTDKPQGDANNPQPKGLDANKAGMSDKSALPVVKKINAEQADQTKPAVIAGDKIVIPKTGLYSSVNSPGQGDSAHPAAPAPAKPIDTTVLEKDAEAIRKAAGSGNRFLHGTDIDAINKILEGKTEAERKVIDQLYRTNNHIGLEQDVRNFESGSDLDKFLNVFHRQDNNENNDNARRIHEDLLERKNWIQGRSGKEIEKDIRDTLSTHNSAQIAKMETEFKNTYNGSLRDAILNDPNLSDATKQAAKIYLQGNDQRTDKDTATLIDTALKSRNLDYFAEAMRDASPAARKAFRDNKGPQRLTEAFGDDPKTLEHATALAEKGKLDASVQIEDNKHLINNAKGIELAIKNMSADERKMYMQGKSLAAGQKVDNLTGDDAKNAKAYYDTLHQAMSDTGNSTDLVKWEDLIATKGSGSFIQGLASNRGVLWNNSNDKITDGIRNLSQSEWEDAKKNPERRDQLKAMLASLNQNADQVKNTLSVYDKMMAAGTYEQAKDAGKQSVLQQVDQSKHWYGADDRDGVLNSVSNMSQEDQARYKNDADFRKQLDDRVKAKIHDPEGLDAAQRMLAQVRNGKSPNGDVIANVERLQNADGSKTGEAVEAIEKAFRDDPKMRDRILHPANDEERKFAEQFKNTVQGTFGDDYDNFGKPFVEQGRLPLELKLHLEQGVFSNDYDKIFDDLKNATPEEKERLKTDPTYRQQVLGFMDENRQKIAMAVCAQGELKVEDKIRAAAVGWGGSSDIVTDLKGIKPQDLEHVESEYTRKYGSSLEGDLASKLGGQDKVEAERVFTQNLNQEQRLNIARDQTENSRSGFGAWVSDNVWGSGTGAQADDALNRTNALLSEKNKMEKAVADGSALAGAMTPQQKEELQKRMTAQIEQAIKTENQATDNHVEAKKAAAEYVGDGTIAAVAIGSMIVTGGADAPLVLALAAAGAGIKVGTNAALEGNDYDWSVSQVSKDALVGSVTAAASVLGPAEIAAVFGVGKAAAGEAATMAIAQIGEQTLKQGGKEALESGTREIVRDALASGAKKLEERPFLKLADKVIAPEITGAEREAAVKALATSLQKNVTDRMATGIVRTFTKQGLNIAGGGVGGGAGGAVQGTTEWDSRKGLGANLGHVLQSSSQAAISGAIGGGVMSAGMDGLGHVFRAVRGSAASESAAAGQLIKAGVSSDAGRTLAGGGSDAGRTLAGATVVEGAAGTAEVLAKKAADEAEKAAEEASQEAARKASEEASKKAANQAANNAPGTGTEVNNETGHRHRHRVEDVGGGSEDDSHLVSRPQAEASAAPELRLKTSDAPDERLKTSDATAETPRQGDAASRRQVDPERIKELTAEIAAAQNRPPIGKEQFSEILNKFPASDKEGRALAMEVMEQSVPNMHRRALDVQLQKLSQQIEDLSANGTKEITVVALSDDSAGKALGYLLKTNTGLEVKIKVLDPSTIAEGISPTRTMLVLDDLSKATPEQKALLSKLPKFYASDLNGFESGVNLWDLGVGKLTGSTESMQNQMVDLVGQAKALRAAHPDLSNEQAVQQVLRSKLDQAAEEFPNAQIVRPDLPERSRQTYQRDINTLYDKVISRPLYDQRSNTFQEITGSDIDHFLDRHPFDPGDGKPTRRYTPNEKEAVALMLRDGVLTNSYDSTLRNMEALKGKLADALPPGKTFKDVVILTQMEENGSQNLIQHLFSRVNDLGSENFASAAELQANPAKFKDKVLVYMDDYSFTGRQQEKLFSNPLANGVGSSAAPLGEAVQASGAPLIIAHMGSYQPHEKLSTQFKFPVKFVDVHDGVVPQLFDVPALSNTGFTDAEIKRLAGKQGYFTKDAGRNVETGVINPYRSHPTNNRGTVRAFINKVWKEDGITPPRFAAKVPNQPSEISPQLWRGRAPQTQDEFNDMLEKTGADLVVDLRGGDRVELDKVRQEADWAKQAPGKDVHVVNIDLPTEIPLSGTPGYEKLLTDINHFESVVKEAQKDGKTVYFHCHYGQDRTGFIDAVTDVLNNGMSVDDALAKWQQMGTPDHPDFFRLFNKEQFEQILNDYKARYPSDAPQVVPHAVEQALPATTAAHTGTNAILDIERPTALQQLAVLKESASSDPALAKVDFDLKPVNAWSRASEPLGQELTNFAHTPFVLNGKQYESMEGFYHSLRYLDRKRQDAIAAQWGLDARKAGSDSSLKVTRYMGQSIELGTEAHHQLLYQALVAKFEQNPDLAQRFVDTYPRPVIHDTGFPDEKSSLWPNKVFARDLMRVRQMLIDSGQYVPSP